MSWSYSGNPAASTKDAVRFEIPDTVETRQLVTDEEVTYALAQESGVLGAAAHCCEVVSRRYTQQADISTGDLRLTYSKQAETLAARAKQLRLRAQGEQPPVLTGTSEAEKESLLEDEDRVPSRFRRGQFDAPFDPTITSL